MQNNEIWKAKLLNIEEIFKPIEIFGYKNAPQIEI